MDREKLLDGLMDMTVAVINNARALNDRANASNPILKLNQEEQFPFLQCLRAVDSIKTLNPVQVLEMGKDGINRVTGYRFDSDFIRYALENISSHEAEGLVVPLGVKDALPIFFQPLESRVFETVEDYNTAIEKVQELIQKKIDDIKGKIRGELEERDRLCQRRDAALKELGVFKHKILRIMEKIPEVPPSQKFEPWGPT